MPSLSNASPRRNVPPVSISPALVVALAELAAIEGLPVNALIAVLLNEAVTRRWRRVCS